MFRWNPEAQNWIYYFAQNRCKVETRCHSFSPVPTNDSWVMEFLTDRYESYLILKGNLCILWINQMPGISNLWISSFLYENLCFFVWNTTLDSIFLVQCEPSMMSWVNDPHHFLLQYIKGVDRINSKNGVDWLKTSLTVHTVHSLENEWSVIDF